MIEIITPDRYPEYESQLVELYRLRCEIFKERLGWDVSTRNGLEYDFYDSLKPTYFVRLDDDRHVIGTVRILPTTGPCLIPDVFASLLGDVDFPNDPCVWEATRLAVALGSNATQSLASVGEVTRQLYAALAEHGLASGIKQYFTVYDPIVSRFVRRIGCPPDWESQPQQFGQSAAMLAAFKVTTAALNNIRSAGDISGSVVARAPWRGLRKEAA